MVQPDQQNSHSNPGFPSLTSLPPSRPPLPNMAPSSKLKQSSMDSFLRSKQTTSISPSTLQPATASEYERIRQETIRRNQDFLQKLGIAAPKPPPPKRTPKPHPTPASSVPLRRSTRKRPLPPPSSSDDGADAGHAAPVDPSEPSFVDSSVFRYACDASDDSSVFSSKVHPSASSIMGFRTVGKAFRDPSLAKIYSLDVCFLNKNRFLLSAAGHGGFISVYGGGGAGGEDGVDGNVEGAVKGETEEPLMSWKGSWSWISGVKFVEDNPMLMLSSSNDGCVVLWDIKKQPVLSSSWSPPVVAKSMELHAGGIFAMDRLRCSIATASKDSSVGISRLTPAGEIVTERQVAGHHSGVIRGVCFGDDVNKLADCGADGCICVLDTRLPEACALSIKSEHSTGINTVEWCTRKSLLLSASKDPTLHLYDVRNSAEPVLKLEGHVDSNIRSCYQIYRPCFVEGEKSIATPGQGSRKISLYDVDSGTMISQGMIGYDANLVAFTDCEEHPRLWSAGRQINHLCPLTQSQ